MMTTLRIGCVLLNELYNESKGDPQPRNEARLTESPIAVVCSSRAHGTSSPAFSARAISLQKIVIIGISGIRRNRIPSRLPSRWLPTLVGLNSMLFEYWLRDALLPKLISGELRVRDAGKVLADATG